MNAKQAQDPSNSDEQETSFALDEPKLQKVLDIAQRYQLRNVLEFGSGKSTAAFCSTLNDANVVSVESSSHYLELTKKTCESLPAILHQPTLLHCPLRWQTYSKRYYLSYALSTLPEEIESQRFDLCFIDGPVQKHTLGGREFVLYNVFEYLNAGAVIVLDDSHRADSKIALKNWLYTFGEALEILHSEPKMVALRKTEKPAPCRPLTKNDWLKHHLKVPLIAYKQVRYPVS